jgi:hypothetical protein
VSVLEAPIQQTPIQLAMPGTYPVPPGRGRWRLTIHARQFAAKNWQSTIIGELTRARNRKLVQAWDAAAVLTFDMDGQAPAAGMFTELATDVIAWRWDDTVGVDRPVFRGVISASEDQLDEESHVVNVTATDYLLPLVRRILWGTQAVTNVDQDSLVASLLTWATTQAQTSSGHGFGAGAYLPLTVYAAAPDGTPRGSSVSLGASPVTRTYFGNQIISDALDQLAKSDGGFDYDVLPLGGVAMGVNATSDQLRIFYPAQGVVRTSPALVYGSSVAKVQRQVTSADYGNFWRELGNNANADPNVAQLVGEAYNVDASGSVVGLWANPDNAADVTIGDTLSAQAQGKLNRYGVLIPVYTLTLRPGFYYAGAFNMGDTLPLIIMHGRLAVNTTVRVMAITYDIGDDGEEDVAVVVGRPDTTLVDVLGRFASDVDALARR